MGNTLARFSTDFFFTRLADTFGIERHFFWDIFGRRPDGLIYQYECGQSTDEFIAAFRRKSRSLITRLNTTKRPSPKLRYPVFSDEEFISWFTPVLYSEYPRESITLLKKLRAANYRLYILSNAGYLHAENVRCEAAHGVMFPWMSEIFSLVDRYIVSCDPDIRCRKMKCDGTNRIESEEIFRKALAIAECSPREAIFVDDIFDYVRVFENMGGHGIHFTGSWTRVEAELYRFGVRW